MEEIALRAARAAIGEGLPADSRFPLQHRHEFSVELLATIEPAVERLKCGKCFVLRRVLHVYIATEMMSMVPTDLELHDGAILLQLWVHIVKELVEVRHGFLLSHLIKH